MTISSVTGIHLAEGQPQVRTGTAGGGTWVTISDDRDCRVVIHGTPAQIVDLALAVMAAASDLSDELEAEET